MRAIARVVVLAAVAAPVAFGHSGDHGEGLAGGFAHPWTGADHLLAMLAVGAIAARHAGPRALALPAVFVAGLIPGALLAPGAAGAETLIVLGLVALGALLAAPRSWFAAGLAVAGLAGLAHGAAHGAEVAMDGGALIGLAAASAVLHGLGLGGALAARRLAGERPARWAGAALAAAGLALAIVR